MPKVDLHMHTTASDGAYTPAQLIALAAERGITTLAITDHDTTDGIEAATAAATPLGICVIPGIELSAEVDGRRQVHMLGYFVQRQDAAFQERLRVFREGRYERGQAIVRKLNKLGVPLTFEQVQAEAGDAPITRPHIALAMVKAGFAESRRDAFDRYLDEQAPAYVPREKLTPAAAVKLIQAAGGVAVMAHPGRVPGYQDVLKDLIANGIDGVEQNHPSNSPEVAAEVGQIAAQHNLIVTGGSDFHRRGRDGSIHLGDYNPPPGTLERLRAARR